MKPIKSLSIMTEIKWWDQVVLWLNDTQKEMLKVLAEWLFDKFS